MKVRLLKACLPAVFLCLMSLSPLHAQADENVLDWFDSTPKAKRKTNTKSKKKSTTKTKTYEDDEEGVLDWFGDESDSKKGSADKSVTESDEGENLNWWDNDSSDSSYREEYDWGSSGRSNGNIGSKRESSKPSKEDGEWDVNWWAPHLDSLNDINKPHNCIHANFTCHKKRYSRIEEFVQSSKRNSACYADNSFKEKLNMGMNLAAPQAESDEVFSAPAFVDLMKTARPFDEFKENRMINGKPCGNNLRTSLLHSMPSGSLPKGPYTFRLNTTSMISRKTTHKRGALNIVNNCQGNGCPALLGKCTAGSACEFKVDLSKAKKPLNLRFREANGKPFCIDKVNLIMPGGRCKGRPDLHAMNPRQCGQSGYESFNDLSKDPTKIVFNPAYIKYLKPFGTLRSMKYTLSSPRPPKECVDAINAFNSGRKKREWYDIPDRIGKCFTDPVRGVDSIGKVTDMTWGSSYRTSKDKVKSVPPEVLVELANQTQTNPWVVIPHNATNAYIKKMALAFRKLDPQLKVQLEYSNETWNGQFWGSKYVDQMGIRMFPNDNQSTANAKYYALRSAQTFQQWNKFFEEGRTIRTLGTMQSSPQRTKIMLEYLSKKDDGRGGKMIDTVDSVATATYFYNCWDQADCHRIGYYPNNPSCQRAKKEGKHLSAKFAYCKRHAYQGLKGAKSSKDTLSTLLDAHNPKGVYGVQQQIRDQAQILRKFKKSFSSYEGGQHLTMKYGELHSLGKNRVGELRAMMAKANNDPVMKKAYSELYKTWMQEGGGTHSNFISAQSWSRFGQFGMSQTLYDKSVKYGAALDYIEKFKDCGKTSPVPHSSKLRISR